MTSRSGHLKNKQGCSQQHALHLAEEAKKKEKAKEKNMAFFRPSEPARDNAETGLEANGPQKPDAARHKTKPASQRKKRGKKRKRGPKIARWPDAPGRTSSLRKRSVPSASDASSAPKHRTWLSERAATGSRSGES